MPPDPNQKISSLDLAAFLIDSRLTCVREELFSSQITDEDQLRFVAALLRVAYSHGLCDAHTPGIKSQIEMLGFTVPQGR